MLGNEKLLKLADTINNLVDIGEEIMKDDKVSLDDIAQLGPLAKEVKSLIDLSKDYKSLIAEGKDIDPVEAVQIVQALLDKK